MHTNNQTKKQNCLICNTPLLKEVSLLHLLEHHTICKSCMSKFDVIDKTISFYHHPLRILYFYNDFFKSLLFQYKGQYDYVLKDAFLSLFIRELKEKYKDYMIVVAPSSFIDNQKRGFAPMEEIGKTIHSNLFLNLYKKEHYKQSDLSFEERKNVKDRLGIENGEILKGKKILIIDDVLTSGSTLHACLNLTLTYSPKHVELLVLSTGRNIEEIENIYKN